jgi:hypothetical protein
MNLKFEERPYSGKTFRPRPEIFIDPQSHLVVVATPWGPREAARKVIDRIGDYLSLAREDREATSPIERLSCLSTQANNLRIAALLANEALYRDDNRSEYRSGVELFAAMLEENEFVWVQAGNPQILLGRRGRNLLPLGSQVDLSFDLSTGSEILPALPGHLLGLDNTLNLSINSFRARAGDRVVLLSHSYPAHSVYTMKDSEASLDSISRSLALAHPDLAFWLGILSIGGQREETAS